MKKVLQKFWPVCFLMVLWLIFSSPYFLKGNVPFASTYQTTFFAPWSAYPHNGMPVKNAAMPDVIGQIYPWKHLAIDIWKSGQFPLWNPYSFSGTPLLANYQSAVLSPFNLLFFILPFVDGWSWLILLQPLLAGLFTYILARRLRISNVGSLVSAISCMFCGFLVTWMGYGTLGYAILFLPLGMFAIESYFQTEKFRYLILLSISLPLSFFSGHFQISIYVALTFFAYIIYRAIQDRSFRKGIFTLLHFLVGLFVSLPQLLPSLEFYTQSLRSTIFQKTEVIPWQYFPTFFAPDFFGNPVTRNDWFGHYAEWNGYVGILPVFLSFLGVLRWKKSVVLFLTIGGVIALLMAFPTPLQDAVFGLHIPVLGTSAESRIIGIYSFLFGLLAGLGWDKLMYLVENKKIKTVAVWSGICLLILFVLWGIIFGKLWIPFDKITIAKQNLFLPTFLALGGFIAIVITYFLPKKYTIVFLSAVVLCIVSIDMMRFATKWQTFDPKSLVFSDIPTVSEIEHLSGYNRSLGNYSAEVSNYYHLPGVEGYDALYSRRYGEFLASLSDGRLKESSRSVVSFPKNGTDTPQAINLLNITYIIHKLSDDNAVWTFPYWQYPNQQFVQIYQDTAYRVLKNTQVLPHAFLADSFVVEKNSQKILNTMFAQKADLRNKLILEEKPGIAIAKGSKGTSSIVSYTPDKVTIKTSTSGNMLLFVSDAWYPGWNATVDGKNVSILRADFTFRAVAVPSGKHIVIFNYFPWSFIYGIFGVFFGLIILLGSYFFQKRRV